MEHPRRKLNDMEELDETTIISKPWANALMQRSISLTRKVVLYWCSFVIKIDEKELNMEEKIKHFENKVEETYEELILDIETVHEKYLDKIRHSLTRIDEICKELQVTVPLFDLKDTPLKELRIFLLKRQEEYERKLELSRKMLKPKMGHKKLESPFDEEPLSDSSTRYLNFEMGVES